MASKGVRSSHAISMTRDLSDSLSSIFVDIDSIMFRHCLYQYPSKLKIDYLKQECPSHIFGVYRLPVLSFSMAMSNLASKSALAFSLVL
jgi:hypothetical protein